MSDLAYAPFDTFYAAAAFAEEVGMTRAAISDAVKRGTLQPDAIIVSPGNPRTPIFRRSTIERFKVEHKRRKGSPGLPAPDQTPTVGAPKAIETLELNPEMQGWLMSGFSAAITRIAAEREYAREHGASTEHFELAKNLLQKMDEVTGWHFARDREITVDVSPGLLVILLAAMELSAQGDERFAVLFEKAERSAAMVASHRDLASRKRASFPAAWWEALDWKRVIDEWGTSTTYA